MPSNDAYAAPGGAATSPYEALTQLRTALQASLTGLRGLSVAAGDPAGCGAEASETAQGQKPRDVAGPLMSEVLALVPTDELPHLFGELVAMKALAEGASAAVLGTADK